NGARLLAADDPARRSRGSLPLAALRGEPLPDREQLPGFDGFHLVRATPAGVAVLTWDGDARHERQLAPGDHVIVNRGVDVPDDPVVARFLPALRATPSPDPGAGKSTVDAWADWVELAAGGGLDPAQPGALLVRREYAGHAYGSTSVSLVALAPGAVRYDFSGSPWNRDAWRPVLQPE
ncbi:MAG TPA: hypothetical protein VJT31_38210, partial [Rugosimonospora sp.]|nr:hypothetical protein [Rugosimonospora sp.]